MNGAQLHLLVNHFPVLLPLVSLVVVLVGLFLRSTVTRQVGLCVLIAGSVFAIPTFLTGEPAESVVKNYPGPTRDLIHRHEAAALPALYLLEATGIVALTIFLRSFKRKVTPRWLWVGLVILNLLSFVAMARVAHFGGQIRHEEIEDLDTLQAPI